MFKHARIDLTGRYRVLLTRWFDPACTAKCCEGGVFPRTGFILWVLNNPSTADGTTDDPTIRRLWAFTRACGYNAMHVANTNCYRSTEPKDQLRPPEDILAANDEWLANLHKHSAMTICAWGDRALPDLVERAVKILHAIGPLYALRVTRAGNPQHPLYLSGSTVPQLWAPTKWIS